MPRSTSVWGIVLLAAVAIALLWAFGGDTHALIPLYSVGVFLCFTLSQSGMVRHWLRVREPGWQWRLAINAGGAVLTAIVHLPENWAPVTVTGQFDHPSARQCRAIRAPDPDYEEPKPAPDVLILDSRSSFVVTAIKVHA